MTTVAASPLWKRQTPARIAAVLLGGLVLSLLVLALLGGSYRLLHAGRVLPGVHVAGVDLSRMTTAEAAAALETRLTFPRSGQVVFRSGESLFIANPGELGMVFDIDATIRTAYAVGRRGGIFGSLASQIRSLKNGETVQPVVLLDQRIAYDYLQGLAGTIDQPLREADLQLEGSEVIYIPGQTGRWLDVDATMVNLVAQLRSFRDGEVALVLDEQVPRVLDAQAQAETLRQFLSAPLVLSVPHTPPGTTAAWVVDVPSLAAMMEIRTVEAADGAQIEVRLLPQAIQPLLDEIAGQIDQAAENPRFIFDDTSGELQLLQPGVAGSKLDGAATLEAIQAGLLAGQHEIGLVIIIERPAVSDDTTAASLGISELVAETISYFRGSGSDRMQNIETAGLTFHGLLIPPGATFSMGDALGDVSLENGYREAMIIYNGRTIQGVGGGVCQVSTTLFRTAFFGGYPIVERTPHAYRVYYYEQTAGGYDSNLAGLDATVYFPLVDLKFTNDRSAWLLMEVYVNKNAQRITWKFYSSNDGRLVETTTTGIINVVPAPEPLLVETGELPAGVIKQVDWAADGADVVWRRTVTRNGVTLFSDFIPTQYQPWQAVCEYGAGTEDPVALAASEDLCQAP